MKDVVTMHSGVPRRILGVWTLVILVAGTGCSGTPEADRAKPAPAADPMATIEPQFPRIVVLGDSIAAGLGLPQSQAFPAQLQAYLDVSGYSAEVVNAGVSGDTTAGALRRLDWALDGDVRILIVALGGNDGLRGLPVEQMKANLGQIIETAQSRGIAVLLAGMEAPPNFGPSYTARFRQVFIELTRQYHVSLVPFLLAGVAGRPELNQADGIHPNPEGARMVADTVWQALHPMLDIYLPQ
jgi:acyl-CoA thioesterase-1